MKHSVQFAQREETREYYSETDLAAEAAPGNAHNPFRRRNPAETAASAPAEAGAMSIDDLVGELEAALMADLHSVSTLLDPQAATAEAGPSAPDDDDETVDAEALQRLMRSIRQPAPRPEETAAAPGVRPKSPMPEAKDDASRTMQRAGGRSAARREPPGRRLQSSLIVGAALVALAGGGAFMTVQSVTAHDNAAPVPAQDAAAATVAAAPIAAPAKAEDRAPGETAAAPATPPAALRTVAVDPEPAAATPSDARGDLGTLGDVASNSTIDIPAAADGSVAAAPAAPAPERLASVDPAPATPVAAPAPMKRSLGTIGAGPAKIASGVKLRSNPDNGAPVVGLLDAGTRVTVVGCKGWCEVVAGDKRGFVFQRFLAQGGAG